MKIITQIRNSLNMRYGQEFTFDNAQYAWRRQPHAQRMVVKVVNDAIGKGFNVIDHKSKKPLPKNTEIMETISSMWLDISKTLYYERAYGKSLGSFYDDEKGVPLWRTYDEKHYYSTYDEWGIATQYNVINRVGGTNAISRQRQIIDDDLNSCYELILREGMEKGEGISVLEPVWDIIFGLATLDEQATYYAVRYGTGIRYLKIPEKKFKDEKYMSGIMSMLRGSLGANGLYALPYGNVNGVTEEISINSESATQIDFIALRTLLLGSLSVATGIPLEVLLGSQLGLRSSEKNEDAYFEFLQNLQDAYRPFFIWFVRKLNEKFKWFAEGAQIEIEYISRDTLNADELLDQAIKKVKLINDSGYQVPKEWLENILNMELEEKEIDPLGINGEQEGEASESEDIDESEDIAEETEETEEAEEKN